ncbi:hypothetical protein NW762_012908 [Fusarium torreyae]|uniref:Uncharacterized protein n=1 Tax=Fusarium torreyae TaxID=1237075 RepID=A0A9W8VB11_9HYPO|nr:hypothetical protein NW762_012908 [Fusarium torreyae]
MDNISTDKDIQVEYAPYIFADMDAIKTQVEVFIVYQGCARTWVESEVLKLLPTDPQPVDLNLVSSSNPLFAEYDPLNGNAFSMVDTLKGKGDVSSEPTTVKQATVSCYVYGWYALEGEDLLGSLDHKMKPSVTRGQHLAALKMQLDQKDKSTAQGVADWKESLELAQLTCHGAMCNVEWQKTERPKHMPADDFFEKSQSRCSSGCRDHANGVVAPIHQGHTKLSSSDNEDDIKKVMQDLQSIEKLLHARDDGVDAQVDADDKAYNWNYANSSGSLYYLLAQGSNDKK